MKDDNIPWWASLIGMGISAFVGYSSGKKDAYEQIENKMRDAEIENLKKQIAELKKNKEINE